MPFLPLDTPEDLDRAVEASHEKPVVIFKHSATCPISAAANSSMNRIASEDDLLVYRLVVQSARALSNDIAQRFGVRHESPQALVLVDGGIEAHASHFGVTVEWLRQHTGVR